VGLTVGASTAYRCWNCIVLLAFHDLKKAVIELFDWCTNSGRCMRARKPHRVVQQQTEGNKCFWGKTAI
jgi:hypothetical protein